MDNSKKGKKKKIIEKPHFPGGRKALSEYLRENMVYPEEALKNGIEGSVYCRYKINHLGKVVDVVIISGPGFGCDEEAVRLIKGMRFELPKIPYKIKAYFQKTMRIHFKLKSVVSAKPHSKYQYQYISKPAKKQGSSYGYTINLG